MTAKELAGKEWRVSECGGVWRVIETLNDGGEWFIARCYDRHTAEAIASLPKMVGVILDAYDREMRCRINLIRTMSDEDMNKLRAALAALDHE